MQLANSDVSKMAGQMFYLDFDGAENMPTMGRSRLIFRKFGRSRERLGLAGRTIIAGTVAQLNECFGSLGLSFVVAKPTSGEYSTVYIGGDDRRLCQVWGVPRFGGAGRRRQSRS